MAKNTIVDAVADAVTRAELAIVRTGRQAVQAVNRKIGAGKRKVAGRKSATKKAARKAVSRTKRTVRKVARKAKRAAKPARRR